MNTNLLSCFCCPYCEPNVFQVGLRSITKEGRDQGKRFGVEQYEMRTFSKDREKLENLVTYSRFIIVSVCKGFQFKLSTSVDILNYQYFDAYCDNLGGPCISVICRSSVT